MSKWQFTKGLHDLGNGTYAWLQPDGSWGYSNAGLIVDSGECLLVDTLFDLELTGEMLAKMRAAVPAARRIDRLVNTHANGDHTFGNQLVGAREIIASKASKEEMAELPAETLVQMMGNWRAMGEAGAFLHEVMGSRFAFTDAIVATPPNRTFDQALTLQVGGKRVELVNVGPAHTKGDVLVHVPDDRTVYTGDILFVHGHPVVWAGPVDNWIAACDRILGWDVETVVPGHGPITDKNGVRALKRYLEYVKLEARKRFDAGMSLEEAVRDISLEPFADWGDAERICVNVNALYKEFAGDQGPPDVMKLFAMMGRYHAEHSRKAAPSGEHGHKH
jgi:glyoxylase-like metal-dependent hydrolase (beta-lactamase superfamily II)